MPYVTLARAENLRLVFLQIFYIWFSNDNSLSRCTPKGFSRLVLAISCLPVLVATFSLEMTKRWHLSALLYMRLLSNQVKQDFKASSDEAIKLSTSLVVAYGVLPSA